MSKELSSYKNTPKIIFVDDEVHLHDIIKLALDQDSHEKGYEILHFYDAAECYEYMFDANLDGKIMIFSDILMPNMDGMMFLRQIKKAKPDVRFNFITATSPNLCLDVSMDWQDMKFFSKPLSFADIKNEIDQFVQADHQIPVT